ncbi:hypothetical protein EDD36DRAFT_443943 [Exophiala viscosa]|uniref:Coiled-coil domain-containing protein 16 n=1 Tax=Exophiala viscosa TaxID=2486360 RepID=A0AAN6DPU1_9EURO|nr:hypothetical protein EDD36DRAFT_443943 [Exophiala viscosa]
MTDVRSLLAAERQSRRITHPHLSYTKSGVLLCTICNLNVKSEALWEGHLRSANHRKNVVQQSQESTNKPTKRKIEDVDEVQEERYEADHIDARKKAKSKSRPKSVSFVVKDEVEEDSVPVQVEAEPEKRQFDRPSSPAPADAETSNHGTNTAAPLTSDPAPGPGVDEDEWAAFEREVAPLAAAQPPPDYTSATIVAAPVTAEQIKEQTDEDRRKRLETEAEDEKEDEERRLEEEFDVMEEMEERVRKMREKRDALRHPVQAGTDTGQEEATTTAVTTEQEMIVKGIEEEDDDEEDEDDWYS